MTLTDFLLARLDEDEDGAVARAMRAIVEIHGIDCYVGTGPDGDDEYFCEGCHAGTASNPAEIQCLTLCALASVYADHPDFRAEWAVSV